MTEIAMSMIEKAGFRPVIAEHGELYEISGADSQIITFRMQPGLEIQTNPGLMLMMSPGISAGCKCEGCFARCIGGEPCYSVTYTQPESESEDGYLGLTPNFPAKMIPIDLAASGGKIRCKDGAYVAGLGGAKPGYNCDCCSMTCCFGGQGCVQSSVEGEGITILSAGGSIVMKDLAEGEELILDTNALLAWHEAVDLSVRMNSCCSCCCGGEGMFSTVVKGPGKVWLQSMSIAKSKRVMEEYVLAKYSAARIGGAIGGAPAVADEMDR